MRAVLRTPCWSGPPRWGSCVCTSTKFPENAAAEARRAGRTGDPLCTVPSAAPGPEREGGGTPGSVCACLQAEERRVAPEGQGTWSTSSVSVRHVVPGRAWHHLPGVSAPPGLPEAEGEASPSQPSHSPSCWLSPWAHMMSGGTARARAQPGLWGRAMGLADQGRRSASSGLAQG